jgi:hypothetical protein
MYFQFIIKGEYIKSLSIADTFQWNKPYSLLLNSQFCWSPTQLADPDNGITIELLSRFDLDKNHMILLFQNIVTKRLVSSVPV